MSIMELSSVDRGTTEQGTIGQGAIEQGAIEQTRKLLTPVPGPMSIELGRRRKAAVSTAVGSTMPVFAARAGGGILEDVDGNRFIDLGSGIAVTTIGNASPRVVDAVRAQVADFTHTCFMVTPYEEYVAVAEHLNRLTPGSYEKRTALFNSGAEAVENAIKIARAYTGRTAVVAFDHAYHGRTNLTMGLTAKSMPYKSGFGPFAPEIYRAPMSYPFRDALIDKEWGTNGELAAERALTVIDKQIGAANLAAIIIEPVQGEGGFIVPAPGFLPTLRAWCTDNDVVFIADEVQSGFDRTGAMFACEDEGIEPDLIITAKGIADGLPLSGVTGRAEMMDAPARRRIGRHLRRQPPGVRRGAGHYRDHRTRRVVGPRQGHRAADEGQTGPDAGRRRPHRRRPRPRCHDRCRTGQIWLVRTESGVDQGTVLGSARAGRDRSQLRNVRQRAALPAPAVHQRRTDQ